MRAVGELTAREMLLSAAVLGAADMQLRGFLNQVVPAGEIQAAALACLDRIRPLAPQAARLNKQTFRALATVLPAQVATYLIAGAYGYAASAEHREGVTAFIEKRSPQFAG
ncbi:MAG: enoyl-CoA hydratase-related protein, partial [Polaromonas sp.]|uniref:enoyl-CoA hydratase/isomerase family protein n=1 Tax=Polaromonas sp. TaxID=1869339 RepID=UPI002730FFB4